MSWRHVIDLADLLDDPAASGRRVEEYLRAVPGAAAPGTSPAPDVTAELASAGITVEVATLTSPAGATDFVKVIVPGVRGRAAGGDAPTLGIVGRLGGLGARPEQIGFVSDGDGALSVLAAAAKLVSMSVRGDRLDGDVILATHVDPDAPTEPHEPVPFMGSAVSMAECNRFELDPAMDAVISVDTTKGNRIVNHTGIAITPAIRAGWVLRVPETAIDVVHRVTGEQAVVLPITMQDITPYGNDVYHVNSILQPATATDRPVLGLAITTATAVAGCATGATDLRSVDQACRFVIEFAKDFGRRIATLSDEAEFARLEALYGPMTVLQTLGRGAGGQE